MTTIRTAFLTILLANVSVVAFLNDGFSPRLRSQKISLGKLDPKPMTRGVLMPSAHRVTTAKSTANSSDEPVPPSLIDVALQVDSNDGSASPATMWKSKTGLFRMIRPSSIPGICLFHMAGVYLALNHARMPEVYWSILTKEPMLWLTLLSINLVSASSMVINDYYDAKLGRDQKKVGEDGTILLGSAVSLSVARRFLMLLYGLCLLISTSLPGVTTRLAVVSSLMLTYLYTKYLKPRTWIKNISCASIIAFSPLASGLATLNLNWLVVTTTRSALFVPPLWRLFGALFCGLFAREIYMDCNDMEADAASNVSTIPVVYGKPFALRVAALGNLGMSILAVAPHMLACCSTTAAATSWASIRRLVLSCVVPVNQLRRSAQAIGQKGNRELVRKTVDEGLITVVFLLASFV